MKAIVCGGRNYKDDVELFRVLDELHAKHKITLVIHGGATGADILAGMWAFERRVSLKVAPADWKTHGRAAGPIRNGEMLKSNPDMVIAFPGGKGTANMCMQAEAAGITVRRVPESRSGAQ